MNSAYNSTDTSNNFTKSLDQLDYHFNSSSKHGLLIFLLLTFNDPAFAIKKVFLGYLTKFNDGSRSNYYLLKNKITNFLEIFSPDKIFSFPFILDAISLSLGLKVSKEFLDIFNKENNLIIFANLSSYDDIFLSFFENYNDDYSRHNRE